LIAAASALKSAQIALVMSPPMPLGALSICTLPQVLPIALFRGKAMRPVNSRLRPIDRDHDCLAIRARPS
jgi:hypothetical protein